MRRWERGGFTGAVISAFRSSGCFFRRRSADGQWVWNRSKGANQRVVWPFVAGAVGRENVWFYACPKHQPKKRASPAAACSATLRRLRRGWEGPEPVTEARSSEL